MEIKDLAGLSEPLTRLIEVSSAGLGKLTEAHFKKKMADAKAYEIRVVTQALKVSNDGFDKLSYKKSEILAICEKKKLDGEVVEATLQLFERSRLRVIEQEAKRQENMENVLTNAAEYLSGEETVPNEKPSDDWTARFFRHTEDISSQEMQGLWGKILAGEIIRPNTYSLRFLDAIRNISSAEAEIFCKLAQFALKVCGQAFVLSDNKFLEDHSLTFTDLLVLRDIGLVCHDDLQYKFNESAKGGQSILEYGKEIILIDRANDTSTMTFKVIWFTKIGNEILSLVDRTVSTEYLDVLASKLKRHMGVSVSHAPIISVNGNGFYYYNNKLVQL